MQLTEVSCDGELAAGMLAQSAVTILHNDDPVSFAQSLVEASEGKTATLTVNRGGQANGECVCVLVNVRVHIIHGTHHSVTYI